MTFPKTIRLLVLLIASAAGFAKAIAQPGPNPLATGQWAKLSIEKSGVYKISFDLLKKMGFDPRQINPAHIRIFGNEGGMLPQRNDANRPYGLQENAIMVSGDSDGRFDKQDFILFYAQGPDRVSFDTKKNIYACETNLYSTKNFYFITVSDQPGKRVQSSDNAGSGFPVINSFNDYIFHELEEVKHLSTFQEDPRSGRAWYGERFGQGSNEHVLSFPVAGIVAGSTFRFVSDVMGQSYTNSSFKLFINDNQVATQVILPIPNTRYGAKGIHRRDTLTLNTDDLQASQKTRLDVRYEFIKGQNSSSGYLDFFVACFERALALYDKQTTFLSAASMSHAVSTFEVAAVPAGAMIWDITNPYEVRQQAFDLSNGIGSFSTQTNVLKKFIVFSAEAPAPEIAGKVANQDLHGMAVPNLLIVTNPLFEPEAQRLAAHRRSYNNWIVEVVTTDQVYNEYSSGRQDVTAIRDLVRDLHRRSPSILKAVLLFGKSSYDYKDRIANNTNFVPTYQSRNSLHPLLTYSSDDYFAFLEDNEGHWGEDPAQGHTLDIGVGRLPVKTAEEAKHVVDKLIVYDTSKKGFGSWRKKIALVADDGNNEDGFTTLHQFQADQLAKTIEEMNRGAETKKLFMGTYAKEVRPNGESTPALTNDLLRTFDRGSLIINYTGHGSEKQWADENFFNNHTINELDNKLYPFMVTATCEFGRHDNPSEISGAEHCVLLEDGGAIGLVTTARPVNATTNFNLNEAFYRSLFQLEGNSYSSIGEVFRKTKNNSVSGVANRNFSLLADPSMTLALPPLNVVVTEMQSPDGADTLKALANVSIRGEIRTAAGEKVTGFNGVLEATLFDKKTQLTTTGRNNPAFTFSSWDNALFRGKATVHNGDFEISFVVPKNIAYQVAEGKMSFYAYDTSSPSDASGFAGAFKIGGSAASALADTEGPVINAFMGDSTFENGGIVTPDTDLVVRLRDNTGINISSYGIGNSIIAILDDNERTFVLNDYYVADTDDPTSGWVNFPIRGLPRGKHTLTVKAWDVYNNTSSAYVDFVVTGNDGLVIESFGNYPNPFRDNTTLFFTHNRSGDDLQAQVFIQSVAGDLVKSAEMTIIDSDYRVNLIDLNAITDPGKKLSAGLYLARIVVRSLTNGSKNEQVTKLILLN